MSEREEAERMVSQVAGEIAAMRAVFGAIIATHPDRTALLAQLAPLMAAELAKVRNSNVNSHERQRAEDWFRRCLQTLGLPLPPS